MKILIPILCLLLLASFALAEEITIPVDEGGVVKNPPKELQLEYKFKVGEYRRYDMVMIGEGMVQLPGQTEKSKLETRTELTFAQHAKAFVPKDDVWRMEWDMIRGALTLPDFGEITLTIPSLQFEMDKYGAIRKMTGLESLAVTPGLPKEENMAKALGQLTSFGFPRKLLKVGDTWDQEFRIEIADQEPVVVKATSKLVEYEIMEAADCAKIVTTYEAPFKLTAKKPDDASKSAGAGDSAREEKPVSISGVEKGEFYMHFAYTEGRIMRVSGTVETTADLDGKKQAAAETPIPVGTDPETASKLKAEAEAARHDVSIKYTMTSVYNPKMPESAVEKPE